MLANTFSHGLIRDYVVTFGTLFNNIKINRRAASGEDADTIAVPLAYAPQQRYLARITEDLNLDRPVALTLPRMSFEMLSLNYSTERKLNTMQRWTAHKDISSNTILRTAYSPVSYDFNFQLSVYITNIEDGTHIIEQILPYFTPEFTVTLKDAIGLGFNMDLPLVLNSVNMEDSYEGGFDERRIIIWTLDFTLKGNLFGPILDQSIINKVIINLHPSSNTLVTYANTAEQIIIQPAMFANGSPTTKSELSVAPDFITANSDYGISTSIFSAEEDPNVHKRWGFTDGARIGTVAFGPAIGNTTIDGWESFETGGAMIENGTVTLSQTYNHLRHTIDKIETGNYQQPVHLKIFANNVLGEFDQFYGKQFQSVAIRYKTEQTAGTSAVHSSAKNLKWMTTDTNENVDFPTNEVSGRYKVGTITPSASGSLPDGYSIIEWDMSETADWNDRIITALWLELFNFIENDDIPATLVTDIDYIKISTT